MTNNVVHLNKNMQIIVEAFDQLTKDVVSGKITDIMITGITEDGNIVNLSSIGENVLALLGAMKFSTDCVSNTLAMSIETSRISPYGDGDDDDDDDAS